MSQDLAHAQRLRRTDDTKRVDQPAVEDMRLLLVAPDEVGALWAALWALEDELSVLRRLQRASLPRSYAALKVQEIQRHLDMLRGLFEHHSSSTPTQG